MFYLVWVVDGLIEDLLSGDVPCGNLFVGVLLKEEFLD